MQSQIARWGREPERVDAPDRVAVSRETSGRGGEANPAKSNPRRQARKPDGYTLVEILVVAAVGTAISV